MKVTVNENKELQIEEVYSGILLKTQDNETLGICMRDSGFEFNYNGIWYSAKEGKLQEMKKSDRGNILVSQEETTTSTNEGPGQ